MDTVIPEEKKLKYKEIKKILALTMALSLAAPANVFAADIQTQADGNQVVEEPETPQEPENPEEPSTPEIQETDMLVNKEHGVKLTGEGLTSDMQLSVEKLDKKHADVKLMEKEISKKQQLDNPIEIQLLKDGKEIALPHKAELQLPVSEKYNGKEVVVLSCDNEKVKKLKGKVKDGFVYVEVESLNSFGTILDKAVSSGVDKVKTGDETPLAMLSVMFVVGGTLFVVLKRKKKA